MLQAADAGGEQASLGERLLQGLQAVQDGAWLQFSLSSRACVRSIVLQALLTLRSGKHSCSWSLCAEHSRLHAGS